MLKKNIGLPGRIFRLVLACLLLAYAICGKSWLALILSAFTFFESFMSWCIVYEFLGINHCPIDSKNKDKEI